MTNEVKIISGITALTLVILFGAVFFFSKSAPAPLAPGESSRLVREDSPKIATDGAKLTIVEFADFQ
jgi:hypothetical protein